MLNGRTFAASPWKSDARQGCPVMCFWKRWPLPSSRRKNCEIGEGRRRRPCHGHTRAQDTLKPKRTTEKLL